jgi:hypothetical protein
MKIMLGRKCIYWTVQVMSAVKTTKKKKAKKKKTALVVCRDRKEFWTTQAQFWQWARDGIVTKTQDNPLTGTFNREHEELMVLLSNTVLNLAHPNHMREALLSRRIGMSGK